MSELLPDVLVAPVGQFTSLSVHQTRSGPSLLPRVVILHQTGDGFVR